jgi:outer membrane protein TolC
MVLSGLTFQRVISRAVFALLFLTSVTRLPAQPNGIAGTMPEDVLPELKEILQTALKQSPQVFLAAIDLERGEAARIQANSVRWPNLGAHLNYASNEEAISGNTSTQSRASGLFYSISLGQSLFHWGALKNQSAIGRISLLIAQKNYAEAYRALAVTLRQSYLDLVMKKARLRHARFSFKRAESDLAVLKQNAAQFSPATISGRELDLREARLDLDRAEVEFAAGRKKLARFAGLADLPEDKIADDLPRPSYAPGLASSITASVLRGQAGDAFEPQILALRIREAELRQKIESVRLLPKFNAGAGYSLDNYSTVGTNRIEQQAVQRQNVNVSAQWNIFDGFATRAAKIEANATRRMYERRLSMAVEALLEQAQVLQRNLELDAEHLEISDQRYHIALQGKTRIAEEAGLGNLPKVEVEKAESGILISQANAFAARAKFFADWSELVSIAGIDPVLQNLPNRHVREKR